MFTFSLLALLNILFFVMTTYVFRASVYISLFVYWLARLNKTWKARKENVGKPSIRMQIIIVCGTY